MSTENMPEDELDDLFRRAASGYHPEFDPEAWQAMEKKLDAKDGITTTTTVAKTNWKRWGGLILLILFTGIGVWVGYNQLNQNKEVNQTKQPVITAQTEPVIINKPGTINNGQAGETETTNISQQQAQINQGVTKNKVTLTPGEDQPTGPNNDTELTASKRAHITTEKVTANKQQAGIAGKPANRNRVSSFTIGRKDALVAVKTEQEKVPATGRIDAPLSTEIVAPKTDGPITVPATDLGATKMAETKITDTNTPVVSKPVVSDSSVAATNPTQSQSDSVAAKKNTKLLALNRFTISFLVAPDLSTVGFANPGGISTNAGLLLGYNLNSRWSLTTGLVRARKIYDAKPDDYGNKNYWYNRHKPDDISAVCYVLDIPVNIGYNIWQRNKSVVTVQTGLSSYIMKDEEYTYKYLPYGGNNGYNSYYAVKNKNRHLFSMYNLSGYYGHSFAPGITAGVAPFVKVPLAGVGAGKVKLASAGIFLSLSYRYPQ